MNKVFIGLILAVCVLGMALVMLNDRLGRKPEQRPAPPIAETVQPARTPEEIAATARAMELAEATVAPPVAREPEQPADNETERPGVMERPARIEQPKPIVKPEPVAKPEPKPLRPEPVAKPAPKPTELPPVKPDTRVELAPKPEAKPEQSGRTGQTTSPKDTPAGNKTATKFVIYARDKGATVRVGGNSKVDYSSMTLENPDRVVVDLAGDWKFPPNPGVPKNDMVSAVRVGQNGDKTRLVIDLKGKPRKVILVPHKNSDGVDIRVDK